MCYFLVSFNRYLFTICHITNAFDFIHIDHNLLRIKMAVGMRTNLDYSYNGYRSNPGIPYNGKPNNLSGQHLFKNNIKRQ